MAERRKLIQGAVENFFKVFDELKRRHVNVKLNLNYTSFWVCEIFVDNKLVLNYKGNDTNIFFDNISSKLLMYLRGE